MERIREFFGFGEEYDIDEEYNDAREAEIMEENIMRNNTERQTSRSSRSDNRQALSLHSNTTMQITIHEPLNYDESPRIVDDLRQRKAIVLNFEQLSPEVKRNIFDFVNGALYALDGKIQRVNKDIFILAPSNIEIEGLKQDLKDEGVFPW